MPALLEAIASGWSWKTAKPVAVIAQNAFGNVIVENESGLFYRIIPEDLECVLLADSPEKLERERGKDDFNVDWEMESLVEKSKAALGPLAEGECYHLVVPGVLGGAYDLSNIKKISMSELLNFSGFVARKIDGLPDGTKIDFKWI